MSSAAEHQALVRSSGCTLLLGSLAARTATGHVIRRGIYLALRCSGSTAAVSGQLDGKTKVAAPQLQLQHGTVGVPRAAQKSLHTFPLPQPSSGQLQQSVWTVQAPPKGEHCGHRRAGQRTKASVVRNAQARRDLHPSHQ